MNQITLNIYNHETGESFQIVSLEKFILWLNDNDDIFTFQIKQQLEVTQ
jgi:hypothetical protein